MFRPSINKHKTILAAIPNNAIRRLHKTILAAIPNNAIRRLHKTRLEFNT
ncbi:MAG: hypothetical protein QXY40_11235 [Candidatus Methanomethylicia archaeon]